MSRYLQFPFPLSAAFLSRLCLSHILMDCLRRAGAAQAQDHFPYKPHRVSALCFQHKSATNTRGQDCKSEDVSDNAIRLQPSLSYSQDSSEVQCG